MKPYMDTHGLVNIWAGHYRSARETPFKWRFTSGPMVARYSTLRTEYSLKGPEYCVRFGGGGGGGTGAG